MLRQRDNAFSTALPAAAMAFFPIGPLRLRLGRHKNVTVSLFGLVITAPAIGAAYWLSRRRERRDASVRGAAGDDVS